VTLTTQAQESAAARTLEAVHNIAANGGRYLYGETDKMQKLLADQEVLKLDYAGSSAPLEAVPALRKTLLLYYTQ
jgi:hypothetical protein